MTETRYKVPIELAMLLFRLRFMGAGVMELYACSRAGEPAPIQMIADALVEIDAGAGGHPLALAAAVSLRRVAGCDREGALRAIEGFSRDSRLRFHRTGK